MVIVFYFSTNNNVQYDTWPTLATPVRNSVFDVNDDHIVFARHLFFSPLVAHPPLQTMKRKQTVSSFCGRFKETPPVYPLYPKEGDRVTCASCILYRACSEVCVQWCRVASLISRTGENLGLAAIPHTRISFIVTWLKLHLGCLHHHRF